MMNRLFLLVVTSMMMLASLEALEVNRIYGENMVLQREMKVPIRGKAKVGEVITVSFANQTVDAKADSEGDWIAVLEPLKASNIGQSLKIIGESKEVVLNDILVGEVWLGSGQSNMAGKVVSYAKRDTTLAALMEKEFPLIRLRGKTGWQPASSPEVIGGHSAILFAFGEHLHRELKVPIGLYVGAVGGTPSGSWIPKETFDSSDSIQAVVADFAKTYDRDAAQQQYARKLANWQKAVESAKAEGKKPRGRKPQPPGDPGSSTRGGVIGGLFDRYIRDSVGFPIRGVLWDQGEARTGILGLDQHTCMTELIRGWRELWAQGDFPFLFVQKPSGRGNAYSNDDPITREADKFVSLPDISRVDAGGDERFLYTRLMIDNNNAWMVPACDLGATIHPINKWGYGNRAGQVARQKVYQIAGVHAYGPTYDSHTVEGNTVIVKFREVGSGLSVRHSEKIQGFALAGKDGRWVWADAEIAGADSVRLKSSVNNPTKVRFAYAANRAWANLFNKEGLPALAFTVE